jgi:trans-2,3-dihydro-3-hydroxyanthranilate isomerase
MPKQTLMNYHFEQVDVFTKRRFAGNPLAVFTDARGLSADDMQHIAREMNLSETTFVVPSTRADCVVKYFIFTPDAELPFAGHPTIGTAFVLARLGKIGPDAGAFNLEAAVGCVQIRIDGRMQNPDALFFTSPPVQFGGRFENRAEVAAALGLPESDLLQGMQVEEAGCPVMHPYVGLVSPHAVDSVVVNPQRFIESLNGTPVNGVYVFALQADDHSVYARYFSFTSAGTIEDPATGSAASPLGALLVRNGLINGDTVTFLVEQGTHMKRQSFVTVSVKRQDNRIEKVEVGGSAVSVLSGTLVL